MRRKLRKTPITMPEEQIADLEDWIERFRTLGDELAYELEALETCAPLRHKWEKLNAMFDVEH